MGNNPTKPRGEDNEEDFKNEIEEAPLPVEPTTEPDVIVNDSDEPMPDDKFILGLESDYEEIKDDIVKKSEAEGKQYIYRDGNFPGESDSLYFSSRGSSQWKNLEWKRPHEIASKPRLRKEGVTADDVVQGGLGDCWWLSSCSSISLQSKYMKRLIPSDQSFDDGEYVGMFHFRFWRFGSWVDVIVDDELPTKYDRLYFGHCSDSNEFWLPLMEKAYAKLHGSYEAIEGGFAQDALEDLTGGLAINYRLGKETEPHLYKKLLKAYRNDSFICAGIEGTSETTDKSTGLVSMHSYTITAVKKAPYSDKTVNLVRIRNPWGNEVEWKGQWSDRSSTWNNVDDETKTRLDYENKANGEWWMDFDDFKYYFSDVTICTIGPDFDEDGAATGDKWYLESVKGKWIKGLSAGGCINDVDKYATNPQYYMHLPQPDVFDPVNDGPDEKGKCSAIIGLMQEYRRAEKSNGLKNMYLGVSVYKVDEKPPGKLTSYYFRRNREYVDSGKYTNKREVSITEEFEPGHYVILPATFYPDNPGSFLLRVYTEQSIRVEEIY